MNTQLERLIETRAEQVSIIDEVLTTADTQQRDLEGSELTLINAARTRLADVEAEIGAVVEDEQLRTASAAASPLLGGIRRLTNLGGPAAVAVPRYASAGDFLVDHLAAMQHKNRDLAAIFADRRPDATGRIEAIQRAANQTTTDTPGLLPAPIVGPVLNTIDASRPLINTLGPKDLTRIEGDTFSRPHITQHTIAGEQTVEKTALPSLQMNIEAIQMAKETHGGWVNVSRQDIDWTSPPVWNILVQDLADAYAVDTETSTATAFAATVGMNGPVPVASATFEGWMAALYEAAALAYGGAGRLPDHVWCSLDVWGALGSITDEGRLAFPPAGQATAGASRLDRFAGNLLQLPRVVVPSFPPGTCIIGASAMAEFYEQRFGLLSAVEPSILGVEVAYGGYTAFGVLEPRGFTTITPPAVTTARRRRPMTVHTG